MSQTNGHRPEGVRTKRPRRSVSMHEAMQLALEDLKKLSREELAERMTTYEPGVPHYWLGRPVEPITKEELLASFNGGEETPIRYKDISQPELTEKKPS